MRVRKGAREIEAQFRNPRHPAKLPHGQHMQMLPWQMYALDWLTRVHCPKGGRILEVGTGFGTSAYMMANASPEATITTITNNGPEAQMAQRFLGQHFGKRVRVTVRESLVYYADTVGETWDMIYLDADHKRCMGDLIWFNRLKLGGLMVFHDYSPQACPPVVAAVKALGRALGREPDIDMMDSDGIGMAAYGRKMGDAWRD